MASPGRMRIAALTSTNCQRHLTWRLRVELLVPHLEQQGATVEPWHLPRSPAARHKLLTSLRGYDIIWLHRHTFWPRELKLLDRCGAPVVLDIDDPVGYSSSRPFNFALARWLRFRATCRHASAVMAASPALVRLAAAHNAHVYYVPLCADPAAHSMQVQPRCAGEPLRLLWVGSRSTFKYLYAARRQLEAVGRACPQVELIVVGHEQLSLRHLPVHNHRWTPEVDREQLARCHVGLVPIADDRWTRAKATLKPLQYMANGMPFIGSPVGVNVAFAAEGRHGLLANRPAEWVEAVQRLEASESLRQEMGWAGIENIRRCHSPEVLSSQVHAVFAALLHRTRSGASTQREAG
ncbi:MAG: glycosyltransferase [Pirellulales bacterium]|nr:glycosyltransferase [Pirellulales bacterium]